MANNQTYSSAGTSLNQVPAAFRKISWQAGTCNVDIGGGRFDAATQYLATLGVENLVYDPYNRSQSHNDAIVRRISKHKADTATVCNVLNVIDSLDARLMVIQQAASAIKPSGTAYFSVYEGDKSGVGKKSKADCWQNNRVAKTYLYEISRFFDFASLRNGVITATNPKETENVWSLKGIDTHDNAYYRARIAAIRRRTSTQDVQVQKWLGCGYIPERLREDFNIFIKQELRNDNSPLTFTELMTYNTWYEQHPEKVAGTMVGSSSFYFPVLVKGNKSDVEAMFKAALSNNKTKTFRELVEENGDNNESKPKYKVGDKFTLRTPLKTNKKSIPYIEVVGVKKYEDLNPNVQLWQKAHRNEYFYIVRFSKNLVYSESRLEKYFELVGTSETSDELEMLELEAEALALELEMSN